MCNSVGFVVLDTDDGAVDAQRFHHQLDTYHDLLAAFQHELVVAGQIRFALYAIDNQHFGFLARRRHQFDVSGEASSAQAHDAGVLDLVYNLFRVQVGEGYDDVCAVNLRQPFVAFDVDVDGLHLHAPCVHGGVDLRDLAADRAVNRRTDKPAGFCQQLTHFHRVAFLYNRFGRCTDMLNQRDDSLLGQRHSSDGLVR